MIPLIMGDGSQKVGAAPIFRVYFSRISRRVAASGWPPVMAADRREPLPDWRDPRPYQRLARADRAALMWEWVRRDPGYVAWYAKASAVTRGAMPAPLDWGLHFRRGPGDQCARGAPDLAG